MQTRLARAILTGSKRHFASGRFKWTSKPVGRLHGRSVVEADAIEVEDRVDRRLLRSQQTYICVATSRGRRP
jgi:hypothetical protein